LKYNSKIIKIKKINKKIKIIININSNKKNSKMNKKIMNIKNKFRIKNNKTKIKK